MTYRAMLDVPKELVATWPPIAARSASAAAPAR